MPDAATRVQVFFEATGGTAPTGWTETFYSSQPDILILLNDVVAKYVKARVGLLGVGAKIKFIRTSIVAVKRITRVQFMSGKQGDPSLFTTSPADDYDPSQVDLLCRTISGNGKRRQQWISGLPDSQTDQLLDQGITGAFTSSPAWKSYVKAVTDLQLGIRYKIANGPPKVFEFGPITEIQPIMVRNHKKGRPFNLFRGRLPA